MEYVKAKEEVIECEGYSDVVQNGVDDVVVQDGVDVTEQ